VKAKKEDMKMGRIVVIGVGIVLVLASIVGNVVLYDFWNQEKEKVSAAAVELNKLEEELKASNQNKPEEMTTVAEEFIKVMFGSSEKVPEKRLSALSEHVTSNLLSKMTEESHEGHTDHVESFENEVKILQSVYNRVSNTESQVIIDFEHMMKAEKSKSVSQIKMTVKLKYINGEWKVNDYKVDSML
jgi:hypothetical protein